MEESKVLGLFFLGGGGTEIVFNIIKCSHTSIVADLVGCNGDSRKKMCTLKNAHNLLP